MKTLKVLGSAILLSILSSQVMAAELVNTAQGEKVGVVTANTYNGLDDAVAKISKKADALGASSFRIISTNENDNGNLHITAAVYK
ncbi:DUF1471 domain-containing protein [Thorsellia anophelis]|uniref:YdgH/BhsA/McbA-like domain-containing protein n=1 Tax=Thorsellia anophelis DSM 18579 TaxID=1123402 RepID=A0A1I0ERE9_9GAMM|nr:DUF1471 domain-containing protein [Thorsellia anophelis]SET47915.1 Protein of unknown function [Thorsellia anophelis DSM 18579]